MKLLNNLYQVGGTSLSHGFDASAYLLKDARGYLLIDCGTPEGYAQIVQNIRSLGVNPGEIHTILATHGHYDHVGAANLWRRDFGCRLLVHPLDREQVEAGDSALTSASLLYGVEAEPTAVDGVLDTGDVFPVEGGSLEVLHTPGHTRGSVVFILTAVLVSRVGRELFRHQRAVEIGAGLLIIVMGLAFAGLVPGLEREFRVRKLPAAGLVGAPVFVYLILTGGGHQHER